MPAAGFNSSCRQADRLDPPFVAIMSNGTSGDINNINFREAPPRWTAYSRIRLVADALASEAVRVARSIDHREQVTLDARAADLKLGVRKPDAEEIARAEKIVKAAAGPEMKTLDEIYARETLLISKQPDQVEATIQALRIGSLGIVAIPCEVFVEIGLDLKARSPLKPVFTISELANGYNGVFASRRPFAATGELRDSSALRDRVTWEVDAADKITVKALELLGDLNLAESNPSLVKAVRRRAG